MEKWVSSGSVTLPKSKVLLEQCDTITFGSIASTTTYSTGRCIRVLNKTAAEPYQEFSTVTAEKRIRCLKAVYESDRQEHNTTTVLQMRQKIALA